MAQTLDEIVFNMRLQTDQLRREMLRVRLFMNSNANRMASAFNTVQSSIFSLRNTIAALGALGVIGGLRKVIQTTAEFDDGLIKISKTTGLAGKELRDLGEDIARISFKVPIATKNLLEIGEAAGQMGIKGRKNIEAFVETLGRLELATDVIGGEGARKIARILNITGLADDAANSVGKFGAALTALGNNAAATESEILEVAQKIAQATVVFGVSAPDILGFATALREMGLQSEVAGTQLGIAFVEINKMLVVGSKGIKTFTTIMGRSREELSEAFGKDAAGVITEFIGRLSQIEKSKVPIVLNQIGLDGTRMFRVMGPLITRFSKLEEQLGRSNTEFEREVALLIESERAAKSFSKQLQLAANNFAVLGREIGAQVLPSLTVLSRIIGEFARQNAPELATALIGITEAAGVLLGIGLLKWIRKIILSTGVWVGATKAMQAVLGVFTKNLALTSFRIRSLFIGLTALSRLNPFLFWTTLLTVGIPLALNIAKKKVSQAQQEMRIEPGSVIDLKEEIQDLEKDLKKGVTAWDIWKAKGIEAAKGPLRAISDLDKKTDEIFDVKKVVGKLETKLFSTEDFPEGTTSEDIRRILEFEAGQIGEAIGNFFTRLRETTNSQRAQFNKNFEKSLLAPIQPIGRGEGLLGFLENLFPRRSDVRAAMDELSDEVLRKKAELRDKIAAEPAGRPTMGLLTAITQSVKDFIAVLGEEFGPEFDDKLENAVKILRFRAREMRGEFDDLIPEARNMVFQLGIVDAMDRINEEIRTTEEVLASTSKGAENYNEKVTELRGELERLGDKLALQKKFYDDIADASREAGKAQEEIAVTDLFKDIAIDTIKARLELEGYSRSALDAAVTIGIITKEGIQNRQMLEELDAKYKDISKTMDEIGRREQIRSAFQDLTDQSAILDLVLGGTNEELASMIVRLKSVGVQSLFLAKIFQDVQEKIKMREARDAQQELQKELDALEAKANAIIFSFGKFDEETLSLVESLGLLSNMSNLTADQLEDLQFKLRQIRAMEELNTILKEQSSVLGVSNEKWNIYNRQLARLRELLEQGKISQGQFNEAIAEAHPIISQMNDAIGSATDELTDSLAEQEDVWDSFKNFIRQMLIDINKIILEATIGQAIKKLFGRVLGGIGGQFGEGGDSKVLEAAVVRAEAAAARASSSALSANSAGARATQASIGADVAATRSNIAATEAKVAAVRAEAAAIRAEASAAGGGEGGAANIFSQALSIFGFAKGGAFANGGIVSTPTSFPMGVMADMGPEAIMPLARGRDGKLGVRTSGGPGGGGSLTQTTIIDARGSAGEDAIIQAVNRALDEREPGLIQRASDNVLIRRQQDPGIFDR